MRETPHLQRAQILLDQRRFDLAEAELRQLLAQQPEHPRALALLSLCRLNQNDIPGAFRFSEQAIAQEPDWGFPYYLRALALVQSNRVDDAIRTMDRVIELDPTDADYRSFLAELHCVCNRPEQGIESARLGLSFKPEHVGCLNLIARERTRTGHFNEADSLLRTSLEIDPLRAETHSLQGELKLQQGDIAAAQQSFDLALTRAPGQTEAQEGFLETRRASNRLYRRLLPLLLRGERLTAEQPFASRLILLTLIIVLCVTATKLSTG
ncbi:MAG: tetratricopeptide repeat protein, partial [Limisphaerales bacterium]